MTGFVHGCPHGRTCKAKVRAPALATTSCKTRQVPVDYNQPTNNSWVKSYAIAPPLNRFGFIVDFALLLDEHESIDLITGLSETNDDCVGEFTYTTCTLKSSIGEYDITVQGDVVTLDDPSSPRIMALANNTATNRQWNEKQQWYKSTLGGVVENSLGVWDGAVFFYLQRGVVTPLAIGEGYTGYMKYEPESPSHCFSFSDPKQDAMKFMNTMML